MDSNKCKEWVDPTIEQLQQEIEKKNKIIEELKLENKALAERKQVYLYNLDGELLRKFETTQECADYFEKDKDYINHNLKYCKKIRKDDQWYKISRRRLENE